MELFSEIYSRYYELVSRLLMEPPLDRRELEQFVSDHGFGESILHLLPKLTRQDGWRLLEQSEGGYYRTRLLHPPKRALSLLEKAWLKTVLLDPRASLFLDLEEQQALMDALEDVEPLYGAVAIKYFDRYLDGDPYLDPSYRERFRLILDAMRDRTILKIVYPGKGSRIIAGQYAALKLEYSQKDEKFRLYAARIMEGRLYGCCVLNLAKVLDVRTVDNSYDGKMDLERMFKANRCDEPVVIEISKERNALERVMIEFSTYEKHSIYNSETETATCEIYYSKLDEAEVLIKLLSFGPVVRVVGPERFVEMVRERVKTQAMLK